MLQVKSRMQQPKVNTSKLLLLGTAGELENKKP
jgi:hypothetical protein